MQKMNNLKTCFIIGVCFLFLLLNGNASHPAETASTDFIVITSADTNTSLEARFPVHQEMLSDEYEWSIVYIRALALLNESLRAEKNLEALTRLHEKLVSNKGISYTEYDLHFNEFRLTVDSKTESLLRELRHDRKAIVTGERGVLPWTNVRDGWFDSEQDVIHINQVETDLSKDRLGRSIIPNSEMDLVLREAETIPTKPDDYSLDKLNDSVLSFSEMDLVLREVETIPTKPDNFSLDKLNDIILPSYVLAENFPQDKIETFNNLVSFCAIVEKYSTLSLAKARLNSTIPVLYEDFLATVFLICHSAYTPLIEESPKAVSYFMNNVLEPLSNDLKTLNYIGNGFDIDDFIDFHEHSGDILAKYYRFPPKIGWAPLFPYPKSWNLLRKCVQTFWDIQEGNLYKAYNQLTVLSVFTYMPIPVSRPYYYYRDAVRYHWFLFLQQELRRVGYVDFANEIFETELDHYRELINWQLQPRVYLTKRFYEEKVYDNFSAFKKLLEKEYSEIIRDEVIKEAFQKAVSTLRDIDKKADELPSAGKEIGKITLPWIDRESIDRRMGIPQRRLVF